MTIARTDDGMDLYYESTGSGGPIVFVHEFAGDMRSWKPQVRHFAKRYRALTFNAPGHPPSSVPQSADEFNRVLDSLLTHAASGRWPMRDPRAMVESITGMQP